MSSSDNKDATILSLCLTGSDVVSFLFSWYFSLHSCHCFCKVSPSDERLQIGFVIFFFIRRTCRKRYRKSTPSFGQTLPVALTHLRGVLDTDLFQLYFEQFDLWWSSIHRYRTWFCNDSDLIQHPVLSLRRT